MRQYLYLIPILMALILCSSCRKDFEYRLSTGDLEFSKDTVYLDTIFTNIGSSTYVLKVYNRSKEDIQIPNINLSDGQNSDYRLNVDGVAGKEFQDIPILAKDSIYIFIETTFDIAPSNQNEFLYTNSIQFGSGIHQQEVQLVTLIRDAIFLYPRESQDGTKETIILGLDEDGNDIEVEGFVLEDSELNFTNQKPYVIYGYAEVAEGKNLVMIEGTRVYFHQDSGIMVSSGASLTINGGISQDTLLLEKEVIFEGDRLEPEYENLPGQWGTVWLSPGSINNAIDHLTIKNATVGLLVEGDANMGSPTLTLKNTQIYNSTNINLWGKSTAITAENVVLGSAGSASLYCNLGGSYTFTHATIANYWSNGIRRGSALQIDNFINISSNEVIANDLTQANFTNCIIDGKNNVELFLGSNGSNSFNYSFTNCLIKFQDNSGQFTGNPLYDFENNIAYINIFLNKDPDFKNVQSNDFRIGEASDAIGNADSNTALLVPIDILGIDRTISADVGAYQINTDN